MDDTPWLTVAEAADYIRKSKDFISRKFRRGEIKAYKTGKEWRTKKEFLDAYIMGRRAA